MISSVQAYDSTVVYRKFPKLLLEVPMAFLQSICCFVLLVVDAWLTPAKEPFPIQRQSFPQST